MEFNDKWRKEPPPKDTDLTHDSPHHTIGYGTTQAAPGSKILEIEKRLKALETAATVAGWNV